MDDAFGVWRGIGWELYPSIGISGGIMIKTMRIGSTGQYVCQWQIFLRGQGYLISTNGIFDEATELATKKFQNKHRLIVDGLVGNQTLGKAALLGFEVVEFSNLQIGYPEKPGFLPIANNLDRQKIFGPLEFEAAPTTKNPEKIRITNNWDKVNIVAVEIPQLRGIEGANSEGVVYFHRKAERQLRELWKAFENRGGLNLFSHIMGAMCRALLEVRHMSEFYQIMRLEPLLILIIDGINWGLSQLFLVRKGASILWSRLPKSLVFSGVGISLAEMECILKWQ